MKMTENTPDTSPEAVDAAITDLFWIVDCRCGPAYIERGLHAPDCQYESAKSLTILQAVCTERDALRVRVKALEEACQAAYRMISETPPSSQAIQEAVDAIRAIAPKEPTDG